MEIILKFNTRNNFERRSQDRDKYPEDSILNACWIVNCALSAIDENYKPMTRRRLEMKKLHMQLLSQIKKQISKDQQEKYEKYFKVLEDNEEEEESYATIEKIII